ncbi:YggT family protein [Rhizobium deserti]|uniref:YggT family protein n=1 Tax=Rhizobium deserti TaxID=2547961 RepID=UPI001FE20A87|nr:YggT family protein [Rhizobium deserti]
MAGIIIAVIQVIQMALSLYVYILIASAIFSWLYAFNVINSRNAFVESIGRFLYNVTEPVLRPIRRIMPDLGGIDISPIILILLIYFIQMILANPIAPFLLSLTM